MNNKRKMKKKKKEPVPMAGDTGASSPQQLVKRTNLH
jgi:hypothetical protein